MRAAEKIVSWVLNALVAGIAVGLIVGLLTTDSCRHARVILPPADTEPMATVARPCISYPHALVKCGVWSMEDVEAARKDPLVDEHYHDIGIVRIAVLKADEWDYVSFRQSRIRVGSSAPGDLVIRDSVFECFIADCSSLFDDAAWTPRPILIKAGELILEDRAGNRIRARCGNRLSVVPREPKAMAMPPDMEREVPTVVWPDDAPILPAIPIERALLAPPPPVELLPPADELPLSPRGPWRPSLIPPMVGIAAAPASYFFPPVVIGRAPVIRGTPEPRTGFLFMTVMFGFGIGLVIKSFRMKR